MNQRQIGIGLVIIGIILTISLIFVNIDYNKKAALSCEAYSSNPDLDIAACPYHADTLTPVFIMVMFGLSILVMGAGLFLMLYKRKEEVKVDVSKLDENEKTIYQILKTSEGSVYQSDLIKETGFSKVKMTRTLDKMQTKGIIDRQRRGMTNIIVLK